VGCLAGATRQLRLPPVDTGHFHCAVAKRFMVQFGLEETSQSPMPRVLSWKEPAEHGIVIEGAGEHLSGLCRIFTPSHPYFKTTHAHQRRPLPDPTAHLRNEGSIPRPVREIRISWARSRPVKAKQSSHTALPPRHRVQRDRAGNIDKPVSRPPTTGLLVGTGQAPAARMSPHVLRREPKSRDIVV
jgi:hypothetical protein